MLVLTRKLDEEILIGDDIRITIVRLDNKRVRIGVTAPEHLPIVRAELLDDLPGNPEQEAA